MDELTIKQKAAAYDRALKVTKNMIGAGFVYEDVAIQIFPELFKENDNERIKNFISNELACLRATDEKGSDRYNELTEAITWVEKQGNEIIDCPQNHQDNNKPNGSIVFEDFNGGEGFYKLHLDYLNKKQVEEIENIVKKWNPDQEESEYEKIRKYLIDVVNDYCKGNEYEGCIDWLEKQGELVNSLSKGLDNAHERIDELIQKNNELCIKLEKQDQQWPTEWSERDIYIFNNIYMFVAENTIDIGRSACAKECLDWLKSIKQRIGE